MRDAPPPGVTVISFEVNVSGAMLQPGNVDLLAGKGPIQIEVKRLEVETAFLGTVSVPAGSGPFTTLNLTFATPELTFQNNSNPPQTIAGCLPGAVCQIKPVGTLIATVAFNPPLSIVPGSNVGLNVDVKLDTLLTSPTANSVGVDFSLAGAVAVAQSQLKAAGELEDVDDIFGTVKNKNTSAIPNTFDLQVSRGSVLNGIQVDNNTQFDGFICNPVNLANCVQNDDMVQVDLDLLPSGVLLAKRIEKENEEANEQDLEGVVFAVPPTTPTNTFQMVAVESTISPTPTIPVLGSPVTISVQSGANFEVDTDGLNLNSTQQVLATAFTSSGISSLQVGQNIHVQLVTGSGGGIVGDGSAANPFVAKRVRLRMSRFTATLSTAPASGNFNVAPVPGSLLDAAGVTAIQVQTSSETVFEDVSDVTGLSAGDTVSLRGLLFKGPPVTLVTGKVRKR